MPWPKLHIRVLLRPVHSVKRYQSPWTPLFRLSWWLPDCFPPGQVDLSFDWIWRVPQRSNTLFALHFSEQSDPKSSTWRRPAGQNRGSAEGSSLESVSKSTWTSYPCSPQFTGFSLPFSVLLLDLREPGLDTFLICFTSFFPLQWQLHTPTHNHISETKTRKLAH